MRFRVARYLGISLDEVGAMPMAHMVGWLAYQKGGFDRG